MQIFETTSLNNYWIKNTFFMSGYFLHIDYIAKLFRNNKLLA